jgi:hypothetical protein
MAGATFGGVARRGFVGPIEGQGDYLTRHPLLPFETSEELGPILAFILGPSIIPMMLCE